MLFDRPGTFIVEHVFCQCNAPIQIGAIQISMEFNHSDYTDGPALGDTFPRSCTLALRHEFLERFHNTASMVFIRTLRGFL